MPHASPQPSTPAEPAAAAVARPDALLRAFEARGERVQRVAAAGAAAAPRVLVGRLAEAQHAGGPVRVHGHIHIPARSTRSHLIRGNCLVPRTRLRSRPGSHACMLSGHVASRARFAVCADTHAPAAATADSPRPARRGRAHRLSSSGWSGVAAGANGEPRAAMPSGVASARPTLVATLAAMCAASARRSLTTGCACRSRAPVRSSTEPRQPAPSATADAQQPLLRPESALMPATSPASPADMLRTTGKLRLCVA